MNDNLDLQFDIYVSDTGSIVINRNDDYVIIICCKGYNSSAAFNNTDDVMHLHRLIKETSLTYVKFVLKINALQDNVDAMNEFN